MLCPELSSGVEEKAEVVGFWVKRAEISTLMTVAVPQRLEQGYQLPFCRYAFRGRRDRLRGERRIIGQVASNIRSDRLPVLLPDDEVGLGCRSCGGGKIGEGTRLN